MHPSSAPPALGATSLGARTSSFSCCPTLAYAHTTACFRHTVTNDELRKDVLRASAWPRCHPSPMEEWGAVDGKMDLAHTRRVPLGMLTGRGSSCSPPSS